MFVKHFLSLTLPLLLIAAQANAQAPDETLPKLEQLGIPTVQELMTGPPRDWVVLHTDEVIVCEPLVPRPNTLARQREEQDALRDQLSRSAADQREQLLQRIEDLGSLIITLPAMEGSAEYKLPVGQIREILHHEDLMMRRIGLLLAEKNVPQAMELLNRLERMWEDWPGMQTAHNQVLFTDASLRLERNEPEQSLMLIDELYGREASYAGLAELTGQVMEQIISSAIEGERYRKAQFYLNRLNQRYSGHAIVTKYSEQLAALTQMLLGEAAAASASGDHRLAAVTAERAAVIWPRSSTLREAHRPLAERYQRLHVGVLSFPREAQAYFVPADADLREQQFVELPLFEIDRMQDGTAYYRTRFFDEWEPFDLGRRMKFTLRQFRQPYEMQAILSAPDIVEPLVRRLDPSSEDYDERLAAFISSVSVDSPTEFTLEFRRVPPRVEPLLAQVRLGIGQDRLERSGLSGFENVSVSAAEQAAGEDALATADPGGFKIQESLGEQLSFVRKIPEPDGLPQYHLAEIVEHRYATHEKAVQALLRGEVSLLPDVPDWIIRRMQADDVASKQYFIAPYGLPTAHLLQFNPSSAPVQVRELRRALAYAVDRETLLKDVVLRDPQAAHGRLISGPFPSTSPARHVSVKQTRFDLSAAVAMALSAQRKLKSGLPQLKMIVAPGPIEEEASREMVKVWKRIGIQVELIPASNPKPESWDIMYRTLQMPEPAVEMWPFLSMDSRARLSNLARFPDWFKQDLVDLDRTSDQSRAITALQELHRRLWIDMALIPLWEVDQHIVIRKNIHGFPDRLMSPYDRVDRWIVDAWYEPELP